MNIARVDEMREMDREAVAVCGIPEVLLMENAGLAAFRVLQELTEIREKTFLILCGPGNNGGDGLVAARHILSAGGTVHVLLLCDPSRYRGASGTHFDIASRLPVSIHPDGPEILDRMIARADWIIDALLGTGLDRAVEGRYREVILRVNRSGKKVLSLDIPSGVHGDTGAVMGCAVRADATVTFGLPKIGNLLYPGHDRGGALSVSRISFPPSLYEADHLRIALNQPPPLPPRNPSGHKGSFGDVLFIAGAAGYYGAPGFAASAFLKAGGGYSRLAAPRSIIPVIAAKAGEIVFVPQKETEAGSISLENLTELEKLADVSGMVVMGPGLSLFPETRELVRRLTASIPCPLLLDGDGISAVADHPDLLAGRRGPTILTPHLGEMARLTGKAIPDISGNPIPLLQDTAARLNAAIVQKGPHSLIGFPDGRVFVNPSGNAGMATAGSGDVLAGTIPAMRGLGLGLDDAVRKGVFIHGAAGDLAALSIGPDGMTARDILAHLPRAVRCDREGFPRILKDRYTVRVL